MGPSYLSVPCESTHIVINSLTHLFHKHSFEHTMYNARQWALKHPASATGELTFKCGKDEEWGCYNLAE